MQQQHPNTFNLYLLALREFMNVAQTNKTSYYQIAGIHGRPYIPWDNVGTAPGYGGGYCTHTSNLFLPWHRPYLALYEQELYKHVQTIAAQFPSSTRATMQAAAINFRIPYWDWAAAPPAGGNDYPIWVSNQYVSVNDPIKGSQTVLNPLFRYDFHPISANDMVYNPFATWSWTRRDPTSWNASGTSQNNLVNTQIINNVVNFRDRLYNLFTSYSNFTQFGNEAWITSSTTNADSLESLHDTLHSILGSNGHMTYLDYAAFDPIFWLHHAMIDRCFAMYQIVYPNSYVEPMNAVGSTFTYPAGTLENVNSNLPPFHTNTNGGQFTSQSVRKTTAFGYAYPETQSGTAASVKAAINSLYGNTAGSTTSSKVKRSQINDVDAAASAQSATGNDATSYQYVANTVSQKFAMNGSYAIYFFMGNYSDNAAEWSVDPNLVGTNAVFASFASADSMGDMDLKVTGSVPLTTMLVSKVASGECKSLNPADVESYLSSNLEYRVAYFDGTEIPVANVTDLSVSIVMSEVTKAASASDFPTWGASTSLAGVTAGRPGGHKDRYWGADEIIGFLKGE